MIQYFKAAHKMAQSESWDEARAQELIVEMSNEYKKYLQAKRKIDGGRFFDYPIDTIIELKNEKN